MPLFAIREVRIQVKSCAGPIIGKRERAPGFYRWTVGLGRHKKNLIPTDHYDVLALAALGPDVIQFVNAKDVNKKTYRVKPDSLSDRTTEDTWKDVAAKLCLSLPNVSYIMIDPNRIKALAFDYYGTIADKLSLAGEIDVSFPGHGAAFTTLWFTQTQRYCFQNGMMERHIPWSELTVAAFNFACQEMDMTVSDKLRDQWIEADTRLPIYREAPAALARLGARFDLYVLSMGSP